MPFLDSLNYNFVIEITNWVFIKICLQSIFTVMVISSIWFSGSNRLMGIVMCTFPVGKMTVFLFVTTQQ
jgi:hypothetical protein